MQLARTDLLLTCSWSCKHRGGDIHDQAPGKPFDAIVQRLVLMHVPDPPEVLRRLAAALRPGGLVVPAEMDLAIARWLPATPLASEALAWLVEAFPKAGIPTLGPRRMAHSRGGGLRPLGMIGIQPHFGPGDPAGVGRTSADRQTGSSS